MTNTTTARTCDQGCNGCEECTDYGDFKVPDNKPVAVPRVKTVWACSIEGHYTYKGHSIGIARDNEACNWYIIVTAPNGMRDYDGWWRDSAGKTHREAVLEALRGSMLLPSDAKTTASAGGAAP